jgi:putative glutathione S-transferase
MTMITPDRAASAASRLKNMTLSSSSSNCSDMVEEKKTMDDGDLKQCFQKESLMEKQRLTMKQPVYDNMVSSEPGSKFLPEKGRYVLYVSRACPNSHCALMVRTLKGLDETIAIKYVRPHHKDHVQRNWVVSHEIPDDSFASLKSDEGEFQTLREVYQHEHDNTSNTIPLLYDQEHQCIVNNDDNDICTMLNSSFNTVAKNSTLELLPNNNEKQLHEWLFPLLQLSPSNTPPYHYYNLSSRQLEFAFHHATAILQKQRYLLGGNTLSTADLRLFAALVRYDAVYAQYLECPPQLLHNRVLMDYCRDIYQQPGVAATVQMDEIRKHFLGVTTYSAKDEPLVDMLQVPHKRTLV